MEYLSTIAMIVLPIILFVLVLKLEKLEKFRAYLDKLFWVDFIYNRAKVKDKFVLKYIKFSCKFFQYIYLYFLCLAISSIIFTLNFSLVPGAVILVIVFPFMYRLIMGFQFKIHGIKREKY